MLENNADYVTALNACYNLKETLAAMGVGHRYDGVSAGMIKSVVGEDTKVLPISRLLEVCKHSISCQQTR